MEEPQSVVVDTPAKLKEFNAYLIAARNLSAAENSLTAALKKLPDEEFMAQVRAFANEKTITDTVNYEARQRGICVRCWNGKMVNEREGLIRHSPKYRCSNCGCQPYPLTSS